MIVDTHTHLYLPEFDNPADAVRRAVDAGVGHMILPNVDLTTIEPMVELHRQFPQNTSIAMGFHPTEVNGDFHKALDVVGQSLAEHNDVVAVGEIGIDLYWDKTWRSEQMEAFRLQCLWALERDLPIIIHCREGLDEVLEVLSALPEVPRGVFHSFGGTTADVDRIRAVGDFYFGINGIVTFKNSRLCEVLPHIGIDRLLLETDAPYLAPVPHRGKRNESAFIIHTAAHMAASMGIPAEELAEATTRNSCNLFGIN